MKKNLTHLFLKYVMLAISEITKVKVLRLKNKIELMYYLDLIILKNLRIIVKLDDVIKSYVQIVMMIQDRKKMIANKC